MEENRLQNEATVPAEPDCPSGRTSEAGENLVETGKTPLPDRSDEELAAALEAILFTMGDAVEISALAAALEVRESRIRTAASLLRERYDSAGSGIMLQQFDSSLQMSTRPEQYANLIRIAKVPKKQTLSDAVMETLSIIAYRQPITRAEIEEIRGVSCDYAINRLLEFDLIRETGRKDAPGRPILFGTTEQFLRSFGLKDLNGLPAMESAQKEELLKEAEAEVDSRLGI